MSGQHHADGGNQGERACWFWKLAARYWKPQTGCLACFKPFFPELRCFQACFQNKTTGCESAVSDGDLCLYRLIGRPSGKTWKLFKLVVKLHLCWLYSEKTWAEGRSPDTIYIKEMDRLWNVNDLHYVTISWNSAFLALADWRVNLKEYIFDLKYFLLLYFFFFKVYKVCFTLTQESPYTFLLSGKLWESQYWNCNNNFIAQTQCLKYRGLQFQEKKWLSLIILLKICVVAHNKQHMGMLTRLEIKFHFC